MNPTLRRLAILSLSAAFSLAAGCAAQRTHDAGIAAIERGDYEDGIAKLAQATQADPSNLSYRLDLRARQEAAVQKLIAAADDAHTNGKPQLAEQYYRRVLVLEPGNDRARHGLELLTADRVHGERTAKAEAALKARQIDAADTEVRAVLAEDPQFAPAIALATRIEQARGPQTVVPHLRTNDNHPVTLQFRDAPTKMVFEVLARQTGLNFIFDKDVKSDGKTTIFVSQVPVDQAIDLILAQNQLARQILSENMVLIYPSTPAKQKDYQDEIVHTFFLANAAPKDAETMLKTVLGAKTMYIDERSSALTLRDTPEHVRMAEKLIASLDEPEPEVIMEVEVLEINHTLADQIGINYPTSVTLAPTAVTNAATATGTAGLVLADLKKQNSNTITVSSLGITANLSKTIGDTNVLSSPRIRAKNKEKAKILVGNRVPVITSGTSATTGGSFSTSSVQYLEVGLTLEVTPTIHNDGNVAIKVALEVSSIANTLNVPIGNGGTTVAYEISTRNANTVLELKDGETQVLAGLIQDSDTRNSNRIPGLGDLPLLSKLFGSDGTNKTKSEIVLAITPRIIRAQQRPSSETTEFWYGSESQTRSAPFVTPPAPGGGVGPLLPAAPMNGPMQPGGVSIANPSGAGYAAPAAAPSVSRAAPTKIDASATAPAATVAQAAAEPGDAGIPAGSAAASDAKSAAVIPGGGGDGGTPPHTAPSDGKPKVTLEGPDTAKVGDEIAVSLKLAGAEDLGRVRAQVRFDASALQLVSAEPGELANSGGSPKVDLKPGGIQLELGGGNALSGSGSLIDMRFHVVTAPPSLTIDTQVVVVGEDGVASAATAATPLKIAVTQ
jgi:general secretion pathway protein D